MILDALALLYFVADRVSPATLAMIACALLAVCAWGDRNGARS